MNKLYKTNFKTLETEFKDIIKSIRETDSTEEISTSLITRKTYILINKKKLYVTEFTSKNVIKKYYYDLYDENNKVIMKFHSEPHNDKRYQTSTEAFHFNRYMFLRSQDKVFSIFLFSSKKITYIYLSYNL